MPSSTPVLFVSIVEYPYNNSGFVFYTTPVAYLMLVMCLYYFIKVSLDAREIVSHLKSLNINWECLLGR